MLVIQGESKKFGEWKHKTNKTKTWKQNMLNHPQSKIRWLKYTYDNTDKANGKHQCRPLLGSTEE